MPQRINTSDLVAGATLAEPICDPQGRVLCAAGGRLTPALINRLVKWNVPAVLIEIEGDAESGASDKPATAPQKQERIPDFLDEQYMRQVAVEINDRFSGVKDIALMEMLKRMAFKKIVMQGPRSIPGRS